MEYVWKEDYRKALQQLEDDNILNPFTHEEYSVLDKAGRLQLNDEMLEAAGIDSNRVKVEIVDGKVVISKE